MGACMASGLDRRGVRSGATIHPFTPLRPRSESTDLHFALRVDNFPHIAGAFGAPVAHQVVQKVVRVLSDLVGDGGLVIRDGDGLISVLLWEPSLLGGGPIDAACARLIQALSATIAPLPMRDDGQAVHISLSGAWSLPDDPDQAPDDSARPGGATAALARVPFFGEVVGTDDGWAERYRADMADAADLFDALANQRVMFAWQPVRDFENSDVILYRECLLRATGRISEYFAPARLIPALERLGLIRPLDHHVVSRVIDELENDATVTLGVNISAQSAIFDGWWVDILGRLSARPDLARRLVIEITETAQFASISDAIAFTDRMRKLGCRLALDDFGVGHASIRQLLAFKPDIVKVDDFFLGRACLSDRDRAVFNHVVGLAGAVAPIVVVEGARTEDLAGIARTAGAHWQQGHFHGGPTVIRTWLAADDVARIEALRQFQACFMRAAPGPIAGGVAP